GGVFAALGTATSTFNGDINLPTGKCYQVNGSCTLMSAITSLNGLTGATQTFVSNDLISIVSPAVGTVHNFYGSTTPTFGWLNATSTNMSSFAGGIGIGTSTKTAALNLDGSTSAANGVAALYGNALLAHGSGAAFANRFITTVANSAVATSEGLLFRMIDNTSGFGDSQLVRAMEIQANRGTNADGVNTGLLAFGKTFGLQGVTTGSAAGNLIPAGVYAENQGTSTGVALKAYTSTSTTADFVSFYQEGTQIFSGNGLNMQLGMGGSSFTGNFLRFASGTLTTVLMTNTGSTTLGNGTYQAGLAIPFGGLCVDSDGACNASTTGQIAGQLIVTNQSDLAENYFSDEALEPGDLVRMKPSADGKHSFVGIAQSAGDEALVGIVSSAPGFVLGSKYEEDAAADPLYDAYPIALSGRVPVKISLENGQIKLGDKLTSASEKGYAMKARPGDPIIGYALEDWGGPDASVGVAGDSLLVQTEIKQKTNLRRLAGGTDGSASAYDSYKDHGGGVDTIDENGVAKQKEKTPPSGKTSDVLTSSTSDVEEGGGQTQSSIPRILAFVQRSHSKLDMTAYDYFAASENKPIWSIDQETGELKKGFFIDLKEADVINARSILSANGNWSIDENGKLTVKEIQTDKLCVGSTCITETELKALLEQKGIAPAETPPSSSTLGVDGPQTPSVFPEGGETISDTVPPTITILGNNPAEIEVGAAYSDMGVTVLDNVNQNLGYTASVDGPPGGEASGPEFPQGDGLTIDTSQLGTHTIIYTATDQAGNTATASRTVNVVSSAPVVSTEPAL
ncbi:MAG: hypothetical protein UX43_C0024G0001, partial [Candidatus Giovannonibacteria bacterium GW2011_GWB1_46_20]